MKVSEKKYQGIIITIIIIISLTILVLFYLELGKEIKTDQEISPYEYVKLINLTMSDLESNKVKLIDLQRLTYGDVDLQRLHLLKIEAVEIMIAKDRKSIDDLKVELNRLKIK